MRIDHFVWLMSVYKKVALTMRVGYRKDQCKWPVILHSLVHEFQSSIHEKVCSKLFAQFFSFKIYLCIYCIFLNSVSELLEIFPMPSVVAILVIFESKVSAIWPSPSLFCKLIIIVVSTCSVCINYSMSSMAQNNLQVSVVHPNAICPCTKLRILYHHAVYLQMS